MDQLLSNKEKEQFYKNGFITKENLIPKKLLDSAIRAINQELGQGISKDEVKIANAGSWFPSLATSLVITDLYNKSKVIQVVEAFTGQYLPLFFGQIALRFPGTLCTDKENFLPVPYWNSMWHIDGFHSPDNGIPKGEIRNFTMLIGVMLSDVQEDFSGNLVVFPSSHHIIESHFNREGIIDQVKEKGVERIPEIVLPSPSQIKGPKGTVVFAHYSLAHSIAPNSSPNTRYAIYFRVNVRSKPDIIPLKDIWIDYPPMKDVIKENRNKINISDIKGQKLKPKYIDEEYRDRMKDILKSQNELSSLIKESEDLFTKNQWDKAKPLFTKLAYEKPNDCFIQLKTGVCYTFQTDENDVPNGIKYIKNVINMYPSFPNGYSLLAQNFARSKNYNLAIENINLMMNCPKIEDQADSIFDGLKCAQNCLIQLNRVKEIDLLIEKALVKYPNLSTKLSTLKNERESLELWKYGTDWINSPQKDFKKGIDIFTKIVNINNKDYWGLLLLGGCYSWSGSPQTGEKYLQEAFKLNSDLPHGYSALSQCLFYQGKLNETKIILEKFIEKTFDSNNKDHADKIYECIEVAKKCYQKKELDSWILKLKNKYKLVLK